MTCKLCGGYETWHPIDQEMCDCYVCSECGARSRDPWTIEMMCDECYATSEQLIDDINDELERIKSEAYVNFDPDAYDPNGGSMLDLFYDSALYIVDGLTCLRNLRKLPDEASTQQIVVAIVAASPKERKIK